MRLRMLPGIKTNFKNLFSEYSCPLKCGSEHEDSQENLLICPALTKKVNTNGIIYKDIFGAEVMQLRAIKVYTQLFAERTKLLEKEHHII